jgi:hypothetical protein
MPAWSKGRSSVLTRQPLKANAALRGIVWRDTGKSYEDFLTKLARLIRGRRACGCCGFAANASSGPSHIFTRRAACATCTPRANILKRLLIHTSGFNLALLMRQLIGVGTPRGLHGRHLTVVATRWALARALAGHVSRHR